MRPLRWQAPRLGLRAHQQIKSGPRRDHQRGYVDDRDRICGAQLSRYSWKVGTHGVVIRPEGLAQQLGGLLLGDLMISLLLGVAQRPSPRQVAEPARNAVAALLELHPLPNESEARRRLTYARPPKEQPSTR